jgi:hypothetical protein
VIGFATVVLFLVDADSGRWARVSELHAATQTAAPTLNATTKIRDCGMTAPFTGSDGAIVERKATGTELVGFTVFGSQSSSSMTMYSQPARHAWYIAKLLQAAERVSG